MLYNLVLWSILIVHSALLFGENDSRPLSLALNLAFYLGSWWILFNFGIITIHPYYITSYSVFTEIFFRYCSSEHIVGYRQAVLLLRCCVCRSLVKITWHKPHEIFNSPDTSVKVILWSSPTNSCTLLPHHCTGCSPLFVHVRSCSVKQTHTKTCMLANGFLLKGSFNQFISFNSHYLMFCT